MSDDTKFLTMISTEFHRYLMEHEDVANMIPPNALVIFQVRGEDAFNAWHEKTSLRNREADQPVLYVSVNKWRAHSLLEDVTVEKMAA
jgi:hypothetical protein